MIRRCIHVCRIWQHHLLALEGDKDVFDHVLKTLMIQTLLAIEKDTNSEDLNDSRIPNREANYPVCEEMIFVSLAQMLHKFNIISFT